METERQRVAAEIVERLADLGRAAAAQSMDFLAYLIELARVEAEAERQKPDSPWAPRSRP